MAVPVHILSGFLGAGKTTTLLHFLRALEGRERVAVVVNDFGEAAIDNEVLSEEALAIDEIRGACVCCTAPAGFVGAVQRLLDEQSPDRIFVEPTGLAHPADLVDTLRRTPYADRLDVRPVIVLLDPALVPAVAPVAREQLECAGILVANKLDLVDAEHLEAFRELADSLWPRPVVYEVERGRIPLEVLELRADHDHAEIHEHEHDHHHDHAETHSARSWVWPWEVVFSRERLSDVLARLATGQAEAPLVRLKGLFRTDQGTWLLEIAGGRVHERPSAYRRDSRLDVIAAGEVPSVDEWLALAQLTDEEKQVDAGRIEVVLPDRRERLDRDALTALPDGVEDVSVLVPGRRGAAARVRSLFSRLDVLSGELVVVAADGYVTPPVPVDVVLEGLLLHSLDGGPLPADKGGPFRLLIPGDAGPAGPCSNVKSVVQLVVRSPAP